MHASAVLQKMFMDSGCIGHVRRQKALMDMTDSLLGDGRVSVTALGRGLKCNTSEKHAIKRADALLRNEALHSERVAIYAAMARRVLCGLGRVVVSVDWSDTGRRDVRLLRAAVCLQGRALTLHEEVHPESSYNNDRVHRAFLDTLSTMVPEGISLIVVTDAGFHAPWFRAVESHGWSWMGRVRSTAKYQQVKGDNDVDDDDAWAQVHDIHALAGQRPKPLGRCLLTRSRPLEVDMFVSAKPKAKGKTKTKTKTKSKGEGKTKDKNKGRRRNASDYRAARSHSEPWVIVCSLELKLNARRAMKLYSARMQIEQCFRDLKNPRHGLGMRFGNSRKHSRVAILLLIAALATFVLWLVGLVAHTQDWTRHYQANTVRRRRVLSFVFVGMRVIRRRADKLTMALMNEALDTLQQLVAYWSLEAES